MNQTLFLPARRFEFLNEPRSSSAVFVSFSFSIVLDFFPMPSIPLLTVFEKGR